MTTDEFLHCGGAIALQIVFIAMDLAAPGFAVLGLVINMVVWPGREIYQSYLKWGYLRWSPKKTREAVFPVMAAAATFGIYAAVISL